MPQELPPQELSCGLSYPDSFSRDAKALRSEARGVNSRKIVLSPDTPCPRASLRRLRGAAKRGTEEYF